MIKRLLRKIFSTQVISIVIAVMCLLLSLFGASKLKIDQETGILTGISAFALIVIFFSSLFFICLMLASPAENNNDPIEKKRKSFNQN